MKYLKSYPIFESSGLTLEQKEFLNKCTEGTWSLNSEGLVDIEGNFNCSYGEIKSLYGIRFGKVSGDFDCTWNRLISLEGAPKEVGGSFNCSGNHNQLTSLEGSPKKVGVSFNCSGNKLTTLEGGPQEVGGIFDCSWNQLTSLVGAPQEVGVSFYCTWNKLTSLEGGPQKVGKDFNCDNNQLTTLVGAPQKVDGDFNCYYNKLTTLVGAPREVGGYFNCSFNQLTSLDEAPKKYNQIGWTEGKKFFASPPLEEAIEEGSVLVWNFLPIEGRSDKLNDFIEEDPSRIDRLNVLFDRDWYTPSPYAMSIYKAWKRGL